ncbi:PHP domain-containing protein [Alkalinema sp. FACHB-956]|uniref:PHP domain-containing protein n=1 Tax=Alkalinema sp. FACHB-956 TaxID=2692768 RepID=UPI001684BF84|nr:PHP domain-containing protein [Alkalinema sp. FACHB-956]MBD2329906.1 PHP domain-containing protein [Alkalinema sp. FACHB-956]
MAVVLPQTATSEKPAAQDLAALRRVFASVNADSCPYTYNFHMHTTHSDGQLRPDILAEQALEIGLSGFAITDHHQISGFYAAKHFFEEWQQQPNNLGKPVPHLWTGTEITSRLLDVEVHILGYAFDPFHPAIAEYLTGTAPRGDEAEAHQVISAIHQGGGVAVLAHPARYRRSHEDLILAAVKVGIDGVETYYAYGNPKPWRPSPEESQQVRSLSQQYHLLNTCGTDSHGVNLLQRV